MLQPNNKLENIGPRLQSPVLLSLAKNSPNTHGRSPDSQIWGQLIDTTLAIEPGAIVSTIIGQQKQNLPTNCLKEKYYHGHRRSSNEKWNLLVLIRLLEVNWSRPRNQNPYQSHSRTAVQVEWSSRNSSVRLKTSPPSPQRFPKLWQTQTKTKSNPVIMTW